MKVIFYLTNHLGKVKRKKENEYIFLLAKKKNYCSRDNYKLTEDLISHPCQSVFVIGQNAI